MGRDRTDVRHEKWSHFCGLFQDLAIGRGLTNAEIARRADIKEWMVHGWMTGRIYPPIEVSRLSALAEALELTKDEWSEFEMEANLGNCPEKVQKKYRALVKKNAELVKENAGLRLKAGGQEPEVMGG